MSVEANSPTGIRCNVCGSADCELVLNGDGARGITSLAHVMDVGPVVHLCTHCGHLQSRPLEDLGTYYDTAYRISMQSADDDQLYAVVDGAPVYRSQHQYDVLRRTLELPAGAKVLDYGSGKAPTVRLLATDQPDVLVHVFDVSRDYIPLWEQFLTEERWSCYEPSSDWKQRFDVVTSFFSLEHTATPVQFVESAASLLAPDGVFYAVVPNPYGGNASDVLVVDHVNHFSPKSLQHLLAAAGLELLSFDAEAHDLAYVFTARRASSPEAITPPPPATADELRAARAVCEYWTETTTSLHGFEDAHPGPVAVYGAGIVGAFILSTLRDPSRVACVIDRNVHKQGTEFDGHPVVSIEAFDPGSVEAVYVGLNPGRGPAAIDAIEAWRGTDLDFFHLSPDPLSAGG